MKRNPIRLPEELQHETKIAIGETYAELGSMRRCKELEDFGRYRFILVKNLDKQILKLKRKKR